MTSLMNLPATYFIETYNQSKDFAACSELFIDGVSHSFFDTKELAEEFARQHALEN